MLYDVSDGLQMSGEPVPELQAVEVYVDGSFRDGRVWFGYMVVENNRCIHKERGELTGPIRAMRQVGGELKSVVNAVVWAKQQKRRLIICFDYTGIELWVGDAFGKSPWKTNNVWTSKYRTFILANREWIVGMRKVKAHSGHFWNDKVDEFVGQTTDLVEDNT